MSQHRVPIGRTTGRTARRANPAFAGGIAAILVVVLAYAMTVGSLQQHTLVHAMAGLLWTGTDLFMGATLGLVIGGLSDEQSAAMFERPTPKTSFFPPSTALVTTVGGITLAQRLGVFPHAEPWLALFTAVNLIPIYLLLGRHLDVWHDPQWQIAFAVATVGSLAWTAITTGDFRMVIPVTVVAFIVVTILSVQGFGFLMPGEIRMYFEMTSEDPGPGVISATGKQSAMLDGVQGVFQLVLIADMVYLRYGGF